jgi:hypothetical protein
MLLKLQGSVFLYHRVESDAVIVAVAGAYEQDVCDLEVKPLTAVEGGSDHIRAEDDSNRLPGNGHKYFVIENEFLIDVIQHCLICNFSSSSNLEIPSNIERLRSKCVSDCESFSSISFDYPLQLTPLQYLPFRRHNFVVMITSTMMFEMIEITQ